MADWEMYMNNTFKIYTSKGEYNIFTGEGFYHNTTVTTNLHNHPKNEMHIVTGDSSTFLVGNTEVIVPQNSVFIIPAGVFHCCKSIGEKALHCPFQTDYNVGDLRIVSLDEKIAENFLDCVKSVKDSNNYNIVASYISLIISFCDRTEVIEAKPIDDYSLIIESFFNSKYASDVCLDDLAEMLHLSQRQTERLVISCTGKSFRKALCDKRLEIASILMENTSLSLTEIATMIGYKSYAGFWKALKRK